MSLPLQKTIERAFDMSFGTKISPNDKGVSFQLWAPEATQVDLHLKRETASLEIIPMIHKKNGWYFLHHLNAKAGDLYQYKIDRTILVPDPASRYQAQNIHGQSVILDPKKFDWHDQDWQGRPWHESIVYELHVGTFSLQGNFHGVTKQLDYLVDLGITAIELMPIAQFPGKYNWGYDGALLFAPCNSYGKPEDLKELIDKAHQNNIMVFLDVVYNHFGPEGNYLYVYAKDAFFTEEFHTPWGSAINFSGPHNRTVRDFYISNTLYWLEEYHIDGLRFDAVHAIFDQSTPDILIEIAQAVRQGPGKKRHIHLILENDKNQSSYLTNHSNDDIQLYTAQWNDDFHHSCHVLLTGEKEGYYQDYTEKPVQLLGRCLTEGFAYQGEQSLYRDGQKRGEPSNHLSLTAFVSFLQNHDQIGNRAFGERLSSFCDLQKLKLYITLTLLTPSPPLLFMGEEFIATAPFLFFCDFEPDLAQNVREGRRKSFEQFTHFKSPENRAKIPDPNQEETFLLSKLDWHNLNKKKHHTFYALYQELLSIRKQEIIPKIEQIQGGQATFSIPSEKVLNIRWQLGDGSKYVIMANFNEQATYFNRPASTKLLYAIPTDPHLWAKNLSPAKSIYCYFE